MNAAAKIALLDSFTADVAAFVELGPVAFARVSVAVEASLLRRGELINRMGDVGLVQVDPCEELRAAFARAIDSNEILAALVIAADAIAA